MKTSRTNTAPAFDLTKNDGVQPQIENKVITKVFLTNGKTFDIIPGSFNLFVTSGDRPQPYVQFKTNLYATDDANEPVLHTLEIFPASMAGVAFLTAEEEESITGAEIAKTFGSA